MGFTTLLLQGNAAPHAKSELQAASIKDIKQMNASDFDPQLQELQRRSVDRLLEADVFDKPAFVVLLAYLNEKAERIRVERVVSKQVLSCLLSATQAIESRAEYLPEARSNLAMASEFSMLLGLIAIGESLNNRRSGVPRIL
jgi:hypothetical protein